MRLNILNVLLPVESLQPKLNEEVDNIIKTEEKRIKNEKILNFFKTIWKGFCFIFKAIYKSLLYIIDTFSVLWACFFAINGGAYLYEIIIKENFSIKSLFWCILSLLLFNYYTKSSIQTAAKKAYEEVIQNAVIKIAELAENKEEVKE